MGALQINTPFPAIPPFPLALLCFAILFLFSRHCSMCAGAYWTYSTRGRLFTVPLLSREIVWIEDLPQRAAIFVSNLQSVGGQNVAKVLTGYWWQLILILSRGREKDLLNIKQRARVNQHHFWLENVKVVVILQRVLAKYRSNRNKILNVRSAGRWLNLLPSVLGCIFFEKVRKNVVLNLVHESKCLQHFNIEQKINSAVSDKNGHFIDTSHIVY